RNCWQTKSNKRPKQKHPRGYCPPNASLEGDFAMWNWFSRLAPKHRTYRARRRYVRPHLEARETRYCPSGASLNFSDPTGGLIDPTLGAGAGYVLSQFSANGADDSVGAVAVQPNGQIVTGGRILVTFPGSTRANEILLTRYNVDGSLDTSFGSGGHTA